MNTIADHTKDNMLYSLQAGKHKQTVKNTNTQSGMERKNIIP